MRDKAMEAMRAALLSEAFTAARDIGVGQCRVRK
jgi:hypothetical protein